MVQALVMSGGGSRGAFQVGAVRYLYTHAKLRPDIICGSSVGSINGVKLAEAGPNTSSHTAVLDELVSIWRSMEDNQDLWNFTPFLEQRPFLTQAVTDMILAGRIPQLEPLPNFPDISTLDVITGRVGVLVTQFLAHVVVAGLGDAAVLAELKEFFDSNQRSVLNLDPIWELLQTRIDPDAVARSGTKLRLAAVSLEAGILRYVTEDGHLLERDNNTLTIPLESPSTVPPRAPIRKWPSMPRSQNGMMRRPS
jgi:NTE family protein